MPHIVLLISQLPDIVQKSFCTSHGAMDLTSNKIMSQPSRIFLAREMKQKLCHRFSEVFLFHPLLAYKYININANLHTNSVMTSLYLNFSKTQRF